MEQARKSKIENNQEQGLTDEQDLAIETNSITNDQMIQGEGFMMSDEELSKNRARYYKGVIIGDDVTLDE